MPLGAVRSVCTAAGDIGLMEAFPKGAAELRLALRNHDGLHPFKAQRRSLALSSPAHTNKDARRNAIDEARRIGDRAPLADDAFRSATWVHTIASQCSLTARTICFNDISGLAARSSQASTARPSKGCS